MDIAEEKFDDRACDLTADCSDDRSAQFFDQFVHGPVCRFCIDFSDEV